MLKPSVSSTLDNYIKLFMKKIRIILAFVAILISLSGFAQTVNNGSVTGAPAANSGIGAGNAPGWTVCGYSPDLCDLSRPSYLTTSGVPAVLSPDGGTWLGLADVGSGLGECAQTTITGLTVGQTYTLYFCGANFGSGSSIFNGSPATPTVTVGAATQTYSIPMASVWIPLSLTFTATSPTMTLQASNYHPSSNFSYASLDGFNLVSPCGIVAPITNNDTICLGESTTLHASAGDGNFSWYPVGMPGAILSTYDSLVVTPGSTTGFVVESGGNTDTAWVYVNPTYLVTQANTICQGDSFLVGSTYYQVSGTYYDSLLTVNGCDSVIEVNLSVTPTVYDTLNVQICQGQSHFAGGANQTTTGFYNDTLTSSLNCDSIFTTDLIVNPIKYDTVNVVICDGQSYYAGGANQTSTGLYNDTLIAASNCDSIVTTDLLVNPIALNTQNITICQGQTYYAGGANQTTTGIYKDTLVSSLNCDSILTTNLTVQATQFDTVYVNICDGQSYYAGGANQTTTGLYVDTLLSAANCDSILTTDLTVNMHKYDTINVNICDGQSYYAGGANQTTSGTYNDVLVSSSNCDSNLTTVLTVLPTVATTDTIIICDGQSTVIHGSTESVAGVYTQVFTSANSCDSTSTIQLIVNSTYNEQLNYYICENDSVEINGAYYSSPQVFSLTYASVNNCDSTITYNIKQITKPSFTLGPDQELCEGAEVMLTIDDVGDDYNINWFNNESGLYQIVGSTGYYWVNVSDPYCYSVTDSVFINFKDCSFYIYLPNAFTPDKNTKNEIFKPVYFGEVDKYEFYIFNRWGEVIFKTNDIDEGWDGTYKGKDAPIGVYAWRIYLKPTHSFDRIEKIGKVTIVR